MLDAMRNAHLQLVFGDPFRAMDYVEEAAAPMAEDPAEAAGVCPALRRLSLRWRPAEQATPE